MLHVQGRRQAHRVPRHVVGKNEGAHGRLARAGLAHEQDLFLGHFGCGVVEAGGGCRGEAEGRRALSACAGVVGRVGEKEE